MKRVLPHGLRHACAVELVIQQQLGHASQHTTTICLRYIAPVELVEKMRSWTL